MNIPSKAFIGVAPNTPHSTELRVMLYPFAGKQNARVSITVMNLEVNQGRSILLDSEALDGLIENLQELRNHVAQ